jgi:hypothetical protein
MMNRASKYVKQSQDSSPVHRYIADHGQGVPPDSIEHRTIGGREVSVADSITDDECTLIKEAIEATRPASKECFLNSLRLWEYDDRFKYTEGYAVQSDLDVGGIEHAWCMLHGETLVDTTETFDHYHGVTISDPSVLDRYTGPHLTSNVIIGNHRNRHEFLRERGYHK